MSLLRAGKTRVEFERFVAANGDQLLRVGYLIVGELAEAEDLAQECLMRLAKHWPRVRRMRSPDAYARRVLVNLALDGTGRRRRRLHELGSPDLLDRMKTDESAQAHVASLEQGDELRRALRRLPERQRIVLVLRYFGDLSEAQIAQTLGCSPGTVKSASSRGLASLRKALEDDPEDVGETWMQDPGEEDPADGDLAATRRSNGR